MKHEIYKVVDRCKLIQVNGSQTSMQRLFRTSQKHPGSDTGSICVAQFAMQ